MPSDNDTKLFSFTRYASKVALIYFLIRGLPILFMYALPRDMFVEMANSGHWLLYFYPPIPIQLNDVPALFQNSLLVLPALLLETLMVFLFSGWQLRHNSSLKGGTNNIRQWLPLLLITLVWACLARNGLLKKINAAYIAELVKIQNDPYGDFPKLARTARSMLTLASYLSMPLWALVPSWLHFWLTKRHASASTQAITAPTTWRASVFATFLFGFVLLHTIFAQLAYIQLWPRIVAKNNIHLSWAMLHSMDFPMILALLVLPLLAGLLASWLYTKRQHSGLSTNFQIFIRPALLGMATYFLASLILLACFWIAT